jgi:GxxExxY protein
MDGERGVGARSNGYEAVGDELDSLACAVIGAALEVHKQLGPGLLESVYEEAMCVELRLRGIPFANQVIVSVNYKGYAVGENRLDLLVGDQTHAALIVELKAVEALNTLHQAQLITYLKITGHRLGLLINFNVPRLREGGIKRMVL